MRKIGIVTLNGNYNLGNRLQNYALQKVVESLDYQVETLVIKPNSNLNDKTTKKIYIIEIIIRVIKIISLKDKYFLRKKRTKIFKEFTKRYINENQIFFENVNFYRDNYICFIAGSDQIWNPFYNQLDSRYFLQFAKINKRISYAASFGVSNIPKDNIKKYKTWLTNIPNLSVREKEGQNIISLTTAKESNLNLDPTLLLNRTEWLKISKKSKYKVKSPYILTYFLDGISDDIKKIIRDLKSKYNCSLINIADLKDKNGYLVGPSEFINLIDNAKIFLTNSFHGVAFAINLKTDFIAFER